MDPTTAKTPLALLVAALLTVPLTSDAERPVSGQDASRLPDTYQIMVGRDVPEASGELQHLKDVTVAPDGTVYLLDQGSDPWRVPPRVLRLSSTGRLIGAWSNLSAPVSVGVAPGGTVLVVDEAGRRLQRFTPWGTFVDARSLEVHTDSPCHATDAVNALAVGVDGRLYLAAGDRIQVRDADASCVTAWEASDTPKDLAVDSDGLVYASLYDHSKIEVFDPTGRRVLSFGRTGDGPGEFGECEVWSGPYFSHMEPCGPHGLAVATDGTLLAADYGNDRVQRFSRDGDYRGHWPTGSGTVAAPTHLAVGADGTVFVASHRGGLSAYTQDGTRIAVRGAGAPPSRAVRAPRSIDIGPSGDILVADTGNHRIQRMDADGQFLGTWGTLGWGPGELSSPQGVAVAPDGTVVVSDTRNRRLQRFDSDGALVDVLTPTIEGRDVFSRPLGVDVAASGDIYVADAGRDRVIWLGADGSVKGQLGAGPGSTSLEAPGSVAIDDEGALWVADTGNHRIVTFSLTGDLIGEWGSEGSQPGQFDSPTGIDVTRDGAVIVADEGNVRLQRFTRGGAYPGDVEVLGSRGCGPGQFLNPADVAFAADGTLVAVDSGSVFSQVFHRTVTGGRWSDRLVRFGSDGTPLPSWGYGRPGDARFHTPSAVAASSDGTVYVGDSVNRRIQQLGVRGELLETFGEPGCGAGQIQGVSGLAAGANGDLFVSDPKSHRLTRFSADGAMLRSWDPPLAENIDFHGIVAVDEAPTGDIYVAEYQRITRFDREGRLLNTIVPDDGFGTSREFSPFDMTVAGDGTVVTTSSAQPWLRRFSPTGDLESAWGMPDDPAGRCDQPGLVAAVPDGSTYSAPLGIGTRIQHCDRDGGLLAEWGGEGLDPGRFQGIGAIAVAPSGEVFVLDTYGDRVQVFTPTGEFVRWWDVPSGVLGLDMDIASDGTILLLDNYNDDAGTVYRTDEHGVVIGDWQVENFRYIPASIAASADGWMLGDSRRVMLYSHDGDLQRTWRTKLVGPEVFETPLGVATSTDESRGEIVYVADSGNGRIQAYDASNGEHVATLGQEGSKPGRLSQPTGLAVDHAGAVLVADTGNHRLQRFSPSGDLLAVWGSEGSAPGEFDEPMGVAVTDDDTVLVADTGNRRVQAFTLEGDYVGSWDGTGDLGGNFRRPTSIAVAADGNVWVTDGDAQVLVFGTSPPDYWHARMYRDQSLIDGPVHVAAVDAIDFDWGLGPPAIGLPEDGFSARIERPVGSQSGRHDAQLTVFGGVTLSTRRDRPPIVVSGKPAVRRQALEFHRARDVVRLDYADLGGRAALRLDLDRGTVTWLPLALSD